MYSSVRRNADMAELADAPDLGSGGRPCRFKSCYPHGGVLIDSALFSFVLPGMMAAFFGHLCPETAFCERTIRKF